MFLVVFGEGAPRRLIVSGLHGKEHEYTDPFLSNFARKFSGGELEGKLVLRSLARDGREYVSILEGKYWETEWLTTCFYF